ncbi:MAG: stage 0 sporulation protein [Candidatus Hydrogenedentes bacterium]|nr:stage 0 sporulation protein [Candidatus Hydrogenedentota bacterium]
MYTVKIRLRKPRRVFCFLCDDVTLQRDEECLVQSDRGLEWARCILPPEPCPPEMERRYTMRVVRRVDQSDLATHQYLVQEEAKARGMCLERIKRRNLPMKLVDVEYTFDKKKVIFYFTADDRVDFRELVRDLAHELRTRIELRHIQVRDEAKMVGGIGSCGRELCCSTWLNDFKPISMRMAKRQNLSLNPSKISGQCGRLLCCLSYENDQYEEMKRRARQNAPELPVEEDEIDTALEDAVEESALVADERGDWPVEPPEERRQAQEGSRGEEIRHKHRRRKRGQYDQPQGPRPT